MYQLYGVLARCTYQSGTFSELSWVHQIPPFERESLLQVARKEKGGTSSSVSLEIDGSVQPVALQSLERGDITPSHSNCWRLPRHHRGCPLWECGLLLREWNTAQVINNHCTHWFVVRLIVSLIIWQLHKTEQASLVRSIQNWRKTVPQMIENMEGCLCSKYYVKCTQTDCCYSTCMTVGLRFKPH